MAGEGVRDVGFQVGPGGGVDAVSGDGVALRAEEVLVIHGPVNGGVDLGVVIDEVGQA